MTQAVHRVQVLTSPDHRTGVLLPFSTGPEFVPVLIRQCDHARDRAQPDRATLFDELIARANEVSS